MDFYKKAFGAAEMMRMAGRTAESATPRSRSATRAMMLADEYPEMGAVGPSARGHAGRRSSSTSTDVDQWFQQAVAAGAKQLRRSQDQFYGDRSASSTDPFGHIVVVATHKEDLSPEELQRRAAAAHRESPSPG